MNDQETLSNLKDHLYLVKNEHPKFKVWNISHNFVNSDSQSYDICICEFNIVELHKL